MDLDCVAPECLVSKSREPKNLSTLVNHLLSVITDRIGPGLFLLSRAPLGKREGDNADESEGCQHGYDSLDSDGMSGRLSSNYPIFKTAIFRTGPSRQTTLLNLHGHTSFTHVGIA